MYMYIQLSHFKVNDFVLLCIHCVASQTWTLGRLLPVMVGSRVPEDDSQWQFYLTTLTVVDFMLCPEILPEEIAYLKVVLKEHHKRFSELFPDASFIPKMHFLLHVPRLLLK